MRLVEDDYTGPRAVTLGCPSPDVLMALNGDASVKGELLDLTTSYEVSPASEAYVVGYMASAFY